MRTLLIVLLVLGVSMSVSADGYDRIALKEAFNAQQNGVELTKSQDALLDLYYAENPPVIDNVGGPDNFGYAWKDSEEPDGPDYNWIDITGTGTSFHDDMGDDVVGGPYAMGFSFPYYGGTVSDVWIGSNGAINFDGNYISLSNYEYPTTSHGGHIAAFNDDLDPWDAPDAASYYELVTVGDLQVFVIACINWDEYPGNVDPEGQEDITFQYQLWDDGTIEFHYLSVEAPGLDITRNTIAIQNMTRDIGLTAFYNNNIPGYPYDGYAIRFAQLEADASISGYVYDSATNEPIEGASVTFGGFATVTEGNGFYELPDLYSGNYNWTVEAFGYEDQVGNFDILPGANTLDIWMDPQNINSDILIVDVDESPNSGPSVSSILQGMGYTTLYSNDFLEYSFLEYEYVFVFTGVYPNNFIIATGSPEEQVCIDYLNAHGNLYLEGGDVFDFMPPVNLLAMLPIITPGGGTTSFENVMGEGPLAGLELAYAGEDNWLDAIEADVNAIRLLYNPNDGGGCLVVDNSLLYHTACAAFELGMLVDDVEWSRVDIVAEIMNNFDAGVEPDPVNLYLMPVVDSVPAEGGTIVYDARLVSDIGLSMLGLRYGTYVYLPNGQPFGPIDNIQFNLIPFMDITVTGMTVNVPGVAPQGQYIFEAVAGVPNNPMLQVSDSFNFTKTGIVAVGSSEWIGNGTFIVGEQESAVTLPTSFEMEAAYPNPFNPTTTVTIALPEVSDLTVTVFNITGQQVATLVDGQVTAGQHSLVLGGTNLSSGIYFIQATVPDRLNAIQKVTLIK